MVAGGGDGHSTSSPPKGRKAIAGKPFRVGRGSYLDIFVRQKEPSDGEANHHQPALRSNVVKKDVVAVRCLVGVKCQL
jgi:hypothetical protein